MVIISNLYNYPLYLHKYNKATCSFNILLFLKLSKVPLYLGMKWSIFIPKNKNHFDNSDIYQQLNILCKVIHKIRKFKMSITKMSQMGNFNSTFHQYHLQMVNLSCSYKLYKKWKKKSNFDKGMSTFSK